MLHKQITYKDFDDNEVTEDYWFHIGRDEVLKKNLATNGDYVETLQKLQVARNGQDIVDHFEDILGDAVGKREGALLIKNKEIRNQFLYSGAFGQFLYELLLSPDSGASWISAILPKNVQEGVREEMRKQGMDVPAEEPAAEKTVELPSSGVIEGVVQDKPVQAEAPATTVPEPSPVAAKAPANAPNPDDEDPIWLKEGRNPTRQEMMKMSKEDMQLVFKMREAGLIK